MPESLECFVNPLQLLRIDSPWASLSNDELVAQDFLDFLCAPGVSPAIPDLAARYSEISVERVRLFAAPNDPRILEKLIWPMRNAKASYVVGNYLSTLALSGTVAEMLTVLHFELLVREQVQVLDVSGVLMSAEAFERLRQDDRVKALHRSGGIDEVTKRQLDSIRVKRRKYLHLWSRDHGDLRSDALEVYRDSVSVAVSVFGLAIADGVLTFRQSLLASLRSES